MLPAVVPECSRRGARNTRTAERFPHIKLQGERRSQFFGRQKTTIFTKKAAPPNGGK
jgi:hypothetical protein